MVMEQIYLLATTATQCHHVSLHPHRHTDPYMCAEGCVHSPGEWQVFHAAVCSQPVKINDRLTDRAAVQIFLHMPVFTSIEGQGGTALNALIYD